METLIANTDEANLALFSSGLTTGQSVRILSGPFANFVGKLERLDAAGRVRVLLEMMGTAIPSLLVFSSAPCPPRPKIPTRNPVLPRFRVGIISCTAWADEMGVLSVDSACAPGRQRSVG